MKKIQYKNELSIPHKKFTLEELDQMGVKPTSKKIIDSKRYILCELSYKSEDAGLNGYYSKNDMYHAVYDTKTNEFVMFNEKTESPMGPWLVLNGEPELSIPGLNVICFNNYDYDSLDDTNDTWWNEGVLYGVFDEEGNIHRGALVDSDGRSNIKPTKNFIRFDGVAEGNEHWYRDSVDWIMFKGKLKCAKAIREDARVYSVIDYVPQGAEKSAKPVVLYVMQDSCNGNRFYYIINSQTGEFSKEYNSYETLIQGQLLYKVTLDGKSLMYPLKADPQNKDSILRNALPSRESDKWVVERATRDGLSPISVKLDLIDYNTDHDYYIYSNGDESACFIHFAENGDNFDMDIEIPSEFDISKPISLVDLVEFDPYIFEKLPTYEVGSKSSIEKYLEAVVRHLEAKSPSIDESSKDRSLIKRHEKYVKTIASMVEDKIEQEKAKIRAQEQECWDAKKASEPKEPNYDSSLQECIDRERIDRKLKESKERIVKRTKKELDKISKTASEIKTYGDDIL